MSDGSIEKLNAPLGNGRDFFINPADFEELERIIPEIADNLMMYLTDTRSRKQLNKLKAILSNVRWRYGPAQECKRVEPGDEPEHHEDRP